MILEQGQWGLVYLLEENAVAEQVKNPHLFFFLQAFSAYPQTAKHVGVLTITAQIRERGRLERNGF